MEARKDLDWYLQQIEVEAKLKKEREEADYLMGMQDCRCGIYDKWYRYNRDNDGMAYDLGWMEQNKETQVENITFLNGR
jgi:hypothetical protein